MNDLIPSDVAAKIACCSARTLVRKATAGQLRVFRRKDYKANYYLRYEIEALTPKEVKKT